jgi:hypothetical protein
VKYVADQVRGILAWMRATGHAYPVAPASDVEAWEDVAATVAEWHERGGSHPMWARDVQLAAVAMLRDQGLVTITTDVFECDITDDDPGVTIYAHLAER